MKLRTILTSSIALLCSAALSAGQLAQVPQKLNYQGRVAVGGTNFNGTGQFKFALVDGGYNLNQTATAFASGDGNTIVHISVTNAGSGYTTTPIVTISAPDVPGGGGGGGFTPVQATAVAYLNGATPGGGGGGGGNPGNPALGGIVTSIVITNPGAGYSFNAIHTVTIASPPANLVTTTLWSNDGTSNAGGEPTAAVALPVTNGLYAVALGDTALANMTTVPASVFATDGPFPPGPFIGGPKDIRLRVWFDDGVHGFQQLTPDQPMNSAPFAYLAGNVQDGAITSAKIQSGAVALNHIAEGAVGPTKLAPGAIGPLALNTGVTAPAPGQVLSFTNDGLRWVNDSSGLSLPFDSGPVSLNTQTVFEIQATGPNSNAIYAKSTQRYGVYGSSGSSLFAGVYGENYSGGYGLRGIANGGGIAVYGEGFILSNAIGVKGSSWANDGVVGETSAGGKSGVYGKSTSGHGVTGFSQGTYHSGVYGQSSNQEGLGGTFVNTHPSGVALEVLGKMNLYGPINNDWLEVKGNNGQRAYIGADSNNDIEVGSLNGAFSLISFYNRGSNQFMDIRARNATVNTLTINGADLAEPFVMKDDLEHPAGSVMVISDERPGELDLASEAYDKRVAGVISGAQGINTAIRLSQEGVNDQGQPVALTGRVYVRADATNGAIKPGDLLTTSANAGHAMKVTDHTRSQGAILGKAMSTLDEGTGFVLVLVTLQ